MDVKRLGRYAFTGVGYGSVAYLLTLMVHLDWLPTRPEQIGWVLIMSALIGELSQIFESERWSFTLALILHFCGTLVLVAATLTINGWQTTLLGSRGYLLVFVMIYVGVWVIITINRHLQTSKINRALSQRQRALHKK